MENLLVYYFWILFGALKFYSLILWRDEFYFGLALGYQKFDTVSYWIQNIQKFISGLAESVNNYDRRWITDFQFFIHSSNWKFF